MTPGSAPPSHAVVRTPSETRRQAIITIVLLAAAAGVGYLLLQLRANGGNMEALAAAACRGDEQAAAQLRRHLYVVLALVPASTFGIAAYVASVARRARREEVFPPTGMWLIRRPARTFTGAAARRLAGVLVAFAATLAGLGVLLTLIGGRMLALLNR